MEAKIKKVEEELSMSKEDLKKKLEAESNQGTEEGPKDEDDDTCEILAASTKYREDQQKMKQMFVDYKQK